MGGLVKPASQRCDGCSRKLFWHHRKPYQLRQWRLITDLLSPKGESVNDGIDPALCSVSYALVDNAVRCMIGSKYT